MFVIAFSALVALIIVCVGFYVDERPGKEKW